MTQTGFKHKLSVIFVPGVDGYRLSMAVCLSVLLGFIASCAKTPPKLCTNYKTSMIRFLGPDEDTLKIQEAVEPTITVPLSVGFAFAPSYDYGQGVPKRRE
jgi:hypothetical protein